MTFILSHWRTIGILIAVAAYSAFIFHLGGLSPRAKLAALEAASVAYHKESERIAKEKNDDYAKSLAAVRADWDEWMRNRPVKTVRVSAGVCADSAGNDLVSESISAYVASVGQFRSDVEELLAECDASRARLNCAVEWAGTLNR